MNVRTGVVGMALRDRLKRLQRLSEGEMVVIPQVDGSIKRFPPSDLEAAFVNECKRLRGEDLPVHPLTAAAANSSSAEWNRSAFAEMHVVGEIEDLSEP